MKHEIMVDEPTHLDKEQHWEDPDEVTTGCGLTLPKEVTTLDPEEVTCDECVEFMNFWDYR